MGLQIQRSELGLPTTESRRQRTMIDKKKSPAGGETKQGNPQNSATDNIAETQSKSKGDGKNKNKYWVGVLYPENMRQDWQTEIGDLVELPYAYCIHSADKDSKSEHRKDHVHLILVWPNPTTYNHALSVYSKLSADGKKALNRIEPIINIRSKYEYLIHNTETCKKQGKELYEPEDRICGNNFDIGSYEQIGIAEKRAMCKELCQVIMQNQFSNFADFYAYVSINYDDNYFEVLISHSGLFERLTKGNYQKWQQGQSRQPVTVAPCLVDEDTGEVINEPESSAAVNDE